MTIFPHQNPSTTPRINFPYAALYCLTASTLLAGCTSISSTFLQRAEDDAMLGISNGKTGIHDHARPFKGIPVTLKIPTHLDLAIVETLLFSDDPTSGKLTHLPLSKRHLDVQPSLQLSDKVFTVDLKRPAAGSLDYEIEFQNEKDSPQYFQQISYHVVDQTLKDISAVIANLKPIQPTPAFPTANQKSSDEPSLAPLVRTIAWKRFDIHAPDFEDQVLAFVNQHLNDCQSCSLTPDDDLFLNSPTSSKTSSPTRVHLNDQNRSHPNPKPSKLAAKTSGQRSTR